MKALKWIVASLVGIPLLTVSIIYVRNKVIGPVGWANDITAERLAEQMRDPESMRIRSSYVIEKTTADGDREIAICGVVDGKNAFGAYTGGTRFVSLSNSSAEFHTFDTLFVEIEDQSETLS